MPRLPGNLHKPGYQLSRSPRGCPGNEPGNGHRDPRLFAFMSSGLLIVRSSGDWRGGAGVTSATADAPGFVVSFPFVLPCSALVSGGVYSSMGTLQYASVLGLSRDNHYILYLKQLTSVMLP